MASCLVGKKERKGEIGCVVSWFVLHTFSNSWNHAGCGKKVCMVVYIGVGKGRGGSIDLPGYWYCGQFQLS